MGPFDITQPNPTVFRPNPWCSLKDPTRPTHHSAIVPAKATYFN